MSMMLVRRGVGIIALVLACMSSAVAEVRLSAIFADGMVLQRDKPVRVWGLSRPGERVRVEIQRQRRIVRADSQGNWSATLAPMAAGGPLTLRVSGGNCIELKNVLIGDVWLASGQSNMEFTVGNQGGYKTGVRDAEKEIKSAKFPRIRLFKIGKVSASVPQNDVPVAEWREATPESVSEFSAVAYLFGRELHEHYDVPIGLIEATWGGTAAEVWASKAGLAEFPEFDLTASSAVVADEPAKRADYARFVESKKAWHIAHGLEDAGTVTGEPAWASPALDTSAWQTVELPRPWRAWAKDLGGLHGVIWFRRKMIASPHQAGKPFLLHLGMIVGQSVVYFNGEKVSHDPDLAYGRREHFFVVPARAVRSGENTIAVRLVGMNDPDDPTLSGAGIFGAAADMRADMSDGSTVSLAGAWSHKPGADIRDYPTVDPAVLDVWPGDSTPSALFNGMINPITSFSLKGVIWYQGEHNASRPAQYRRLFPSLINDWRRRWCDELPFLFVQLAGFGSNEPNALEGLWAELRDAQAAALALPRTGMATAVDIGDPKDVHPNNKQEVAHRLVLAARSVVFGEKIVSSGPTFRSMEVTGHEVRITFSNAVGGLRTRDQYQHVRGFELAAADGKFKPAQARLEGESAVLWSADLPKPVAVRYSWSNTPDGSLYNVDGLPALPFRSGGSADLSRVSSR